MMIAVKEVRCGSCRSVLFMQAIERGILEIKCRKSHCKAMNIVDIRNGMTTLKTSRNNMELHIGSYVTL